jgi:DNA-binding transcriptional MerR regulator
MIAMSVSIGSLLWSGVVAIEACAVGGRSPPAVTSVYLHVDMKASERKRSWSVGEMAARFDLPTNVLRHWEATGLLSPKRDASGYRRYDADDLVRVAVILRNKAAGMSLEQIRVLLDSEARGRHEVLEAHLRDLADRAKALERSREMTEHALRCRAHDIATCPRFVSYVDDLVEGRTPPPLGRFDDVLSGAVRSRG